MAGASDRLTTRPNPEGNDRERFTAEEMEDYGDWLKSDTDAATDFSRLSSEEENLLGSFSTGSPSSVQPAAGEESTILPSPESPVPDAPLSDEQEDFSDSVIESEIEAEEAIDSAPFSLPAEDYEEKAALADDFVLGSASRRDRFGSAATESRAEFGQTEEPAEPDSDSPEDDISEEFFEIDEEVSSQNGAVPPLPSPTPAEEEIAAAGPAFIPSADSGRTGRSEPSALPARELPDDILARIALELSSIRGELVGIKAGFAPGSESPAPSKQGSAAATFPEPAGSAGASVAEFPTEESVEPTATPAGVERESRDSVADTGSADRDETSVEARPHADPRFSPEFVEELRAMFSYMDKLLESLPDAKIEEFARSPYFDSYKRIFEILGIV